MRLQLLARRLLRCCDCSNCSLQLHRAHVSPPPPVLWPCVDWAISQVHCVCTLRQQRPQTCSLWRSGPLTRSVFAVKTQHTLSHTFFCLFWTSHMLGLNNSWCVKDGGTAEASSHNISCFALALSNTQSKHTPWLNHSTDTSLPAQHVITWHTKVIFYDSAPRLLFDKTSFGRCESPLMWMSCRPRCLMLLCTGGAQWVTDDAQQVSESLVWLMLWSDRPVYVHMALPLKLKCHIVNLALIKRGEGREVIMKGELCLIAFRAAW